MKTTWILCAVGCAGILITVSLGAETKPRLFVTDSTSWEATRGGGARPQTAEIIKTFGERCPQVVVNNQKEKADFVVVFDHEGGKGVARKRNKLAVFNKDGDVIFSGSTRSLGNSVQNACEAIVKNLSADRVATRIPAPNDGKAPATAPSGTGQTGSRSESSVATVDVTPTSAAAPAAATLPNSTGSSAENAEARFGVADSPTSVPEIRPAVATQIVDSTGTAITIAEPTVALTDTTAKETLPVTADAPNNPSATTSPTNSVTASQIAALLLNAYVTNAGTGTTSGTEGTASITSSPDGAEIFVDSIGSGHAPNLAKLKPGKHTVQLVMAGHKDWN